MRIETFPNGEIDEIFAGTAKILIERIGEAQYSLEIIEEDVCFSFQIWTTRKGTIQFDNVENMSCGGILASERDSKILRRFESDVEEIHLENLTRGSYSLAFSSGEKNWGCTIRSHGYVKIKQIQESRSCPNH
jgi:predicted DNA-binding transcriptional regulator